MKTPSPSASLGFCSLLPLLASATADAGIISNTSLGLNSFTLGPNPSMYSWNIDNTGSAEFQFIADSGNLIRLSPVSANDKIHAHSVGFASYKVLDATKGAYVKTTGPAFMSQPFVHSGFTILKSGKIASGQLSNNFKNGTVGYIGFSFQHDSKTCYGWASVTVAENAGNMGTVTINSWAFEDSGANIIVGDVGAVPEPADAALGLGAQALGAAGLRRWRKQKTAKTV